MRLAKYRDLEKEISAAGTGTIYKRWLWARHLAVDPAMSLANGRLQNGVTDRLISAAAAAGVKLSRREVQYRYRFACTYPQKSQVAQISAQYECWWDVIRAGFPPVPAAEDELPYDPRSTCEIERGLKNPPPDVDDGALFSIVTMLGSDATLHEAERYADAQVEKETRHLGKAMALRREVNLLIKAVDGDKSKTIGEARQTLEESI